MSEQQRAPMPVYVGAPTPDKPTTLEMGRSAAVHIPPPAMGGERAALERIADHLLNEEICAHPSGDPGLNPMHVAQIMVDGFPAFRTWFVNRFAEYSRVDPYVCGTVDAEGFARHCWMRAKMRLINWCIACNPEFAHLMTPRMIIRIFEEHFVRGQKLRPMNEMRFTFDTPESERFRMEGSAAWKSSGEVRSGTMHEIIEDMDISESERNEQHNMLDQRSANVEKALNG